MLLSRHLCFSLSACGQVPIVQTSACLLVVRFPLYRLQPVCLWSGSHCTDSVCKLKIENTRLDVQWNPFITKQLGPLSITSASEEKNFVLEEARISDERPL